MVQGALGRSAGESIMSNITVRPMTPEDWAAVSEIYLEGIATEHATFQTTCPPYTAWDAFHIKECRLVILDGGALGGGGRGGGWQVQLLPPAGDPGRVVQ